MALALLGPLLFRVNPGSCRWPAPSTRAWCDKRSLLDKLVILLRSLDITLPCDLAGEICHAPKPVIGPLFAAEHHPPLHIFMRIDDF